MLEAFPCHDVSTSNNNLLFFIYSRYVDFQTDRPNSSIKRGERKNTKRKPNRLSSSSIHFIKIVIPILLFIALVACVIYFAHFGEWPYTWASCQIRQIGGAHAPGIPGAFSPQPEASDPDMHHGTCVTHVPWCMPGSLTSGFLWSRWRVKTFPEFQAHAQPAMLRIW